jgi:TrmH family RNA methyltransferase
VIPLFKLAKLPRHQRLRKIGKIFAEAERCLVPDGPDAAGSDTAPGSVLSPPCTLQPYTPEYLAGLAETLLAEGGFAAATETTLRRSADTIKAAGFSGNTGSPEKTGGLIRAINAVRHLLLAETGRFPADWDFIDHNGRLDSAARRIFPGMSVYLEDIRSPFNVGAMFRTAESFGAARLYLSPHCADPHHPRAERTAMGCVDILEWERLPLEKLPEKLLSEKLSVPGDDSFPLANRADTPVFALETGATPLRDFTFPRAGVMIVGSEELGISPEALALADASLGRVSIPAYGAKASLNVSAAFAIAMQAWAGSLAGPKS